MNKGTAIVGFILSFLAGMGLMWGIDHSKKGEGDSITADAAGGWSDDDSPVPVNAKDPTWGQRGAPVTIVVFSDYQCPFCSRVEGTMDQVKTTYGPDKVRVVWKNLPLPFHPNAKPAAEAGQGVFAMAGNTAFWKFHDLAFKNQQALSTDSYVKWAQEAGVKDIAKYKQGLEAHTWADKVDKDNALAKQLGANGTPHFFINGTELSGAQPFDSFKSAIDAQLAKAQQAIASGTPKDKVYVKVSKENKAAPPPQPQRPQQPEAKKENPEEDDKTVWKVPVGNSPALGPDTALVTMVIFSDYQCPFCKRVEDTLKKVRETYGDKVRLVWKDLPLAFHPRAEPAAQTCREALSEKGNKGFWACHDKLFEMQPKLEDSDLEAAAKELGLEADKVKKAIATHKYDAIDEDTELSERLQAQGTPHFFVNGRRVVGAQPFEKFQSVIDEEIKKAEALVQKGVAKNKVYEEIIKDGKIGSVAEQALEKKEKVAAPTSDNAWKGNAKAKVVIQEFSDFQCPFCKRVEPTVRRVMDKYGDRVKFVWRHKPLPMHPDAPLASEAAQEAFKQKGPDGFWKMHGLLFDTQQSLKREDLEKAAKTMGLDMAKFGAALDAHTHKAVVDADSKVADDAGISGTPAFVVNGYFISGAQPYAKFKKVVEKALSDAK